MKRMFHLLVCPEPRELAAGWAANLTEAAVVDLQDFSFAKWVSLAVTAQAQVSAAVQLSGSVHSQAHGFGELQMTGLVGLLVYGFALVLEYGFVDEQARGQK